MTEQEVNELVPGLYRIQMGGRRRLAAVSVSFTGKRWFFCTDFIESRAMNMWACVECAELLSIEEDDELIMRNPKLLAEKGRLYKLPNGDWIERSAIIMIQAVPAREVLGYTVPSTLRVQLMIAGRTQILDCNMPYEDAIRVRDELAAICNGGN